MGFCGELLTNSFAFDVAIVSLADCPCRNLQRDPEAWVRQMRMRFCLEKGMVDTVRGVGNL